MQPRTRATAEEMLKSPWVADVVIEDEDPPHVHSAVSRKSPLVKSRNEADVEADTDDAAAGDDERDDDDDDNEAENDVDSARNSTTASSASTINLATKPPTHPSVTTTSNERPVEKLDAQEREDDVHTKGFSTTLNENGRRESRHESVVTSPSRGNSVIELNGSSINDSGLGNGTTITASSSNSTSPMSLDGTSLPLGPGVTASLIS